METGIQFPAHTSNGLQLSVIPIIGALIFSGAYGHLYTLRLVHTFRHTNTHMHTQRDTHKHIHRNTKTCTQRDIHTHAYREKHIQAHRYTDTHRKTQAHTERNTDTHTYMYTIHNKKVQVYKMKKRSQNIV